MGLKELIKHRPPLREELVVLAQAGDERQALRALGACLRGAQIAANLPRDTPGLRRLAEQSLAFRRQPPASAPWLATPQHDVMVERELLRWKQSGRIDSLMSWASRHLHPGDDRALPLMCGWLLGMGLPRSARVLRAARALVVQIPPPQPD